jgi:hypothetical protein
MGLRSVLAGTCAMALMCCWPGVALASGGPDIASAPTVAYGQLEFGNTATDDATTYDQTYDCDSWWLVPAIAGDQVTVDWAASLGPDGNYSTAIVTSLYAPGTTDFNFANVEPVVRAYVNEANGRQELKYTAARDGTLPLQFQAAESNCTGSYGPYNFTAYIKHELIVTLSAKATPKHHSTTFRVAAHNPDGVVIAQTALRAAFQLRVKGQWQTIKTKRAPLRFTKTWKPAQRHKFQSVRVSVSGPAYRTATTTVRTKGV